MICCKSGVFAKASGRPYGIVDLLIAMIFVFVIIFYNKRIRKRAINGSEKSSELGQGANRFSTSDHIH